MAIGNQLDLNIVVNGFNQAQAGLQRLGDTFGNLGSSLVNLNSTAERLRMTQATQNLQKTGDSAERVMKVVDNLGRAMEKTGGEGKDYEEGIRDIAEVNQQLEMATYQLAQSLAQAGIALGSLAYEFGVNLLGSMREAGIQMQQLEIQLGTIGKVSEDTTETLKTFGLNLWNDQ